MSPKQHISIDAMGGDFGPRLCVPAVLKYLEATESVSISLVGDLSQIEPMIADSPMLPRIRLIHADQVVDMGERAGSAFRHKRESSMWKSLELVSSGEADACVSSGNTGALMAMSRHLVKTVHGMSRPAICKPIPTMNGHSYLLDMGANLNCSPEQLLQFALMGTALAKVNGCTNPSVALLNIGAETTKGNQEIKQAYDLMNECEEILFQGFIEGNQLYSGNVDVVVCDGFVGNVALKVSEGVATFILDSLKQEFSASLWRRLIGAVNQHVLRGWKERFDPSRYNGAALLGLKKIVVKSHGGADSQGFYQAIATAHQQVKSKIPEKLERCLGLT